MKINLWGINYKPELIGIAVYNTQLSEFLAARGHTVDVVTGFPYYPEWRPHAAYAGKLFSNESLDSVRVHRCWLYVPNRPSVLARIMQEASFVVMSFLRQLFLPAPDVYVVVSPPLLLGMAAWILCAFKRRPYIFHVQDMQPDTALELGMLKPGLFSNLMLWFERITYANATRVSCITTRMQSVLHRDKNLPESKVCYFPNWVSLEQLALQAHTGSWKSANDISPETHLLSYSGNLGVKQGLEIILEAARILKERRDIIFLIAGNGAQRYKLQQLQGKYVLNNVLIRDVMPEEEYNAMLFDSDICFVTQRPGPGQSFFPSKLLKILAYEKPIITNADDASFLNQQTSHGGFGVIVPATDAGGMAAAITELLQNTEKRQKLGAAGRAYITQYDRDQVLSNFESDLERVVSARAKSS